MLASTTCELIFHGHMCAQAYGELGEADQAVRCLSTMRQEGLAPNEITYSAIMCACRSLPAVVCDLLQRMRRENIQPNTVVLTNAIDALARGGSDYIGEY